MIISVEHKVPYDKGCEKRCLYNDGDFWGSTQCAYHVTRDRTHGRKALVEYRKPKCTLFNVWLDSPYFKCEECLKKCQEVRDAHAQTD